MKKNNPRGKKKIKSTYHLLNCNLPYCKGECVTQPSKECPCVRSCHSNPEVADCYTCSGWHKEYDKGCGLHKGYSEQCGACTNPNPKFNFIGGNHNYNVLNMLRKTPPVSSKCERIPLTGKSGKGKFAIVDTEDFEELNQWKWSIASGYARRGTGPQSRRTTQLMHRVIMGEPDGMEVDHINHDLLDNRKSNLRLATKQQNAFNRKPRNTQSGYKGISWQAHTKLWRVIIQANGKQLYGGSFKTLEEAAKRFNELAIEYQGEYAWLNEV